ncbi:MAG: hypothetical protein GQ535_16030 [Rhodobacteraceae bacterium]|nr:hypothetical protein [Paracoccaceae bacterium]
MKPDYDTFKEEIENLFRKELVIYFDTVDYANHLTDGSDELNELYYLRHRVETITRIRMTAALDALALSKMLPLDYEAARKWAKYTLQEMNHDKMFMGDLKRHGVSEDQVFGMEPLPATVEMGTFLEDKIVNWSPLAAVAYSLFVEWNSDQYSEQTVDRAEVKYSSSHVKGARAHVNFDVNEDHLEIMFGVAHSLLTSEQQMQQLLETCQVISKLFRDYFQQLHQNTVVENKRLSAA